MRAINHALTGALIGVTVSSPAVAILAALISHYLLDIIPHFDLGQKYISTRGFKIMLLADFLLCLILVIILILVRSDNWILPSVCAFVATSPDLIHIRYYFNLIHKLEFKPTWIEKFGSYIQWSESRLGIIPEIAWFVGSSLLLWQKIH